MSFPYPFKKCPVCGQYLTGIFLKKEQILCVSCLKKLKRAKSPHVLYLYNDFFRELLFRYKGQGDLALASVFLDEHLKDLKKRYKDYTIVVVPSNSDENFRRGFAFLPWLFYTLKLPIISPFLKQKNYKQALSKHREDIQNVIILKENIDVKDKKLLLVDDVMTSGYTLVSCVRLLQTLHPKQIDVLVLAAKEENIERCLQLLRKEGCL